MQLFPEVSAHSIMGPFQTDASVTLNARHAGVHVLIADAHPQSILYILQRLHIEWPLGIVIASKFLPVIIQLQKGLQFQS